MLVLHAKPDCTTGDPVASGLTLAFVLAPGFFVFLSELKRMCCGKSNIFKALAYLLLSPFWAIVIHLYRLANVDDVSLLYIPPPRVNNY